MGKMNLEQMLSQYVTDSQFEEIPPAAISTAKNILLTNIATIIAGSHISRIKPLVNQVKKWGGKKEATIFMHSGKVPAYNAGFINSVMARALDFDDSMIPGIHIGASTVPTAFAVAELTGGCDGKEFLTALILGTEVSARLNLSDEQYNGFDPTGICSVFGSSAVAGRLLGLNCKQMVNTLALAFNRSAGSFQSHISGSLAVRLNQGFVSQTGIQCAQLAEIGMTGPGDFLSGIYGYFHLYGKDKNDGHIMFEGLCKRYELNNTMFKKYPSCGGTQGSTDLILTLIREHDLTPGEIEIVDIYVTPSTWKLVGKPFKIGDNPRVDAQFNIQYCVANALLRGSSKLEYFDEEFVKDPQIIDITRKIRVFSDAALDKRGLTAVKMEVKTRGGAVYQKSLDTAPGFPGNMLGKEDHLNRFRGCIEYARKYFNPENSNKIVSLVENLEELEDVRSIFPLLVTDNRSVKNM